MFRFRILWFCVVVSWCVVENLYFWYCVEILFVFHEDTGALAEFTDLDADIPKEGADLPSFHDHDCFLIQFGRIYFHGKPRPNGVSYFLFV